MAFRYPNSYSLGIMRPGNSSRQPLDIDPDVYLNRLYINARPRPVIWDMGDEVDSFGRRSRTCGPRLQESVPEMLLPPRMVASGRQDRPLRAADWASQQAGFLDEYGRRSAQIGIVRDRDDALPFSLAITELFRQLEAATKFYISFGKEYNEDIKQIKQYATKEILENLWIRKVRRARSPRVALQRQDEDRYTGNGFAEYEDRFAVWKRKICHALDGAITSRLDGESRHDHGSGTRHQSMVSMIDKIRTANRQLLPLLDTAWERQQLCRDLVTELELLKDLVNPGESSSKSVQNNVNLTNEDNGDIGDIGNTAALW
jgi:hypothetical protein